MMNISKDFTETVYIKKRKSLKIDRQGDFFVITCEHHELDTKDRSARLLQTVEIILTIAEMEEVSKYFDHNKSEDIIPF